MFRKLWISGLAVGLAATSAGAWAGDNRGGYYDDGGRYDNGRYDDGRYPLDHRSYRSRNGDYDYARVVNVEPLRRRIRVSEPVRECWDEPVYRSNGYRSNGYRSDYRSDGPLSSPHVGSTLLGGLIGGVVGNQIGTGRGRDAARVAGALIGGAIGNNISHERQRDREYYGDDRGYYGNDRGYSNERLVERCEVHYRDSWDERIDGYRVTYEYGGRDYTTRMPYDPGERVRIRVDVTPLGG
jgi:uncharacterized protein YcfJ